MTFFKSSTIKFEIFSLSRLLIVFVPRPLSFCSENLPEELHPRLLEHNHDVILSRVYTLKKIIKRVREQTKIGEQRKKNFEN